jgi:hypothetical protein
MSSLPAALRRLIAYGLVTNTRGFNVPRTAVTIIISIFFRGSYSSMR